MGKKNIRSEYVKNLLAEKDNLGAMLSESTSEAIKSFLGESVNKGIRNILSEAEDSFTEEEVDDKTPEFTKKDSKKDGDKKSEKKTDKEFETDIEEVEETETEDGDEFDIEDEEFDSEEEEPNTDDKDSEDDDNETEEDFETDIDMEGGEDDSDDEVWDSIEDFKGEDGEYDLTGQDKDTVMKVLKAMKPEDGVRIVKNDNGTFNVEDEEDGTEYVVELELDDDFEDEPMAAECGVEECDLNEEDLGYTDDYQHNTAMTMDSDNGDDEGRPIKMNAGLPRGSKNNGKRWVGDTNGKMKPYSTSKPTKTEQIFEVELDEDDLDTDTTFNEEPSVEEASTVSHSTHTVGLKGVSPENRSEYGRAPHKSPKTSNENFERKVKAIMAENRELKKIANEIKKRLQENVVVNASLGKIIKLMVENSTTKDEKVNILNRFNKVKSVNESKELYETISNELKSSRNGNAKPSISNQITEAKKTKQQIVESRVNESTDVQEMKDFINRLDKIK